MKKTFMGNIPFRDLTDNQVKALMKVRSVPKVTILDPGVAGGLKKSNYVKRQGGGGSAEPIQTDDPKYNMYANALPKAIRKKVVAAGLDVRALYKEYRSLGRDALVEKYKEYKDG